MATFLGNSIPQSYSSPAELATGWDSRIPSILSLEPMKWSPRDLVWQWPAWRNEGLEGTGGGTRPGDRRAGPCSSACRARGRAAREFSLSPGQPTKLNLRRPLPAQSPRKCGTGSRVIGQRRHGASSAALRSAKVLLWLPVGSAWTLAARQMKLPKFQTTWEIGFGASTASPPIGMTFGGTWSSIWDFSLPEFGWPGIWVTLT